MPFILQQKSLVMKLMRLTKKTDVYIQILFIMFFLLYVFVDERNMLTGYFVVGGWQVLSSLMHIGMGWFRTNKYRKWYYGLLIWVVCFFLAALIIPNTLMFPYLYFFLFFWPCMALFYLLICHYETFARMKRPLYQLK